MGGIMLYQILEPINFMGNNFYDQCNYRIQIRGGGRSSQIFATRQFLAKSLVVFNRSYSGENITRTVVKKIYKFNRYLIVSDYRRCELKKFGGLGSHARFQKSYR